MHELHSSILNTLDQKTGSYLQQKEDSNTLKIVTSRPERDALRQNNDDNNSPDMIQRSSMARLPTDHKFCILHLCVLLNKT